MSILLLGAYGHRNIGDDIYLKIFLDNLNVDKLYFNCADINNLPKDIVIKNNQYAFSSRPLKDIRVKLHAFIQAETIIYGGGELWMQLRLNYFKNASLYKMLFINILAKILHKNVFYVSVGAENLTTWPKIIARLSAKLTDFIILRDHESIDILKLKKGNYLVAPDLAYILKTVNAPKVNMLGINALFDVGSDGLRKKYSDLISQLIVSHKDCLLIPGQQDSKFLNNDTAYMRTISSIYDIKEYDTIDEFLRIVGSCKFLVSSRLHIAITALLSGCLVIGINYKSKILKHFDSIGLKEYAFDISDLDINIIDSININNQERLMAINRIIEVQRTSATAIYTDFFEQVNKANYNINLE